MTKRVLVTGAAGQIGYSLVQQIANGNVFGPNQVLIIKLDNLYENVVINFIMLCLFRIWC